MRLGSLAFGGSVGIAGRRTRRGRSSARRFVEPAFDSGRSRGGRGRGGRGPGRLGRCGRVGGRSARNGRLGRDVGNRPSLGDGRFLSVGDRRIGDRSNRRGRGGRRRRRRNDLAERGRLYGRVRHETVRRRLLHRDVGHPAGIACRQLRDHSRSPVCSARHDRFGVRSGGLVERRRRHGGRSGRRLRGRRRPDGDRDARGQQRERIDVALRTRRDANPEVNVRNRELDLAARTDRADARALVHARTASDGDRAEVQERHRVAVLGLDRHALATVRDGAGEADGASCGREHGGARVTRNVDAAMLPRRVRVALAEREAAQDVAVGRPGPRRGRGNQEKRREDAEHEDAHRYRLCCQG
jgi:hypothetical protein